MNIEQRAMEIFGAAIELEPARHSRYLDDACDGNGALRALVERLLAADADARIRLDRPLPTTRSGERLGSYRLETLIGSGGMGSVYRAARADGAYGKPVAIKLLAFDAGDLRARFAQEQRILGSLSHANIATLLDVGNDNGTPYFVMEYIDGVPITRYAREHGLDPQQRIGLLLPVIDAVQAAHSQLVVHRDIKPGNVLVDRAGIAKLLDFGIAKLIGEEQAVAAQTRSGLRALTPEYASPEQVRGEPVGTASDIYSLGVLLYELLGDVRPYEIRAAGPVEIARIVAEAEPVRPSVHLDGRSVAGNLRDLDAIVLKALAKTPGRRYASCSEFAADLRRWLQRETVLARLPTRRERLLRYVRRHRLGVSVAATAFLALFAGLVVTLYFQREAVAQRETAIVEKKRAEQQTAVAVAVRDFIVEDIIRAASPGRMTSAGETTVREAVDRSAARLEGRFGNQPEVEGELHREFGRLYYELGRRPEQEQQFRLAAAQLGKAFGATDSRTLQAGYSLAATLASQSKQPEALDLLKRLDALAPASAMTGKNLSVLRNRAWGNYHYDRFEMDAARSFFERAGLGDSSADPVDRLVMAQTSLLQERLDEAERIAQDVIAQFAARGEQDTLGVAMSLGMVCRARFFRHAYAEAEPICLDSIARLRKIYGFDNVRVADSVTIINRLQLATGRYREAVETGRQVYESWLAGVGATSINTQAYLAYLGHAKYLAGQVPQGIADSEAGLATLQRVVPPDHPVVQAVECFLAGDYLDIGASRLDAARALVDKLRPELIQRVSPEGDWPARVDALRGQIAWLEGDPARARRLLEPALATMIAAKSPRYDIERAQRTLARLDKSRAAPRVTQASGRM